MAAKRHKKRKKNGPRITRIARNEEKKMNPQIMIYILQ